MVERFNGRIGREVLVMCIGTHDALERLLRGYNLAYNARRQWVLNSQSPTRSSKPVFRQNLNSLIRPTSHPVHATAPKSKSPLS
jgi:hypothetical protein